MHITVDATFGQIVLEGKDHPTANPQTRNHLLQLSMFSQITVKSIFWRLTKQLRRVVLNILPPTENNGCCLHAGQIRNVV